MRHHLSMPFSCILFSLMAFPHFSFCSHCHLFSLTHVSVCLLQISWLGVSIALTALCCRLNIKKCLWALYCSLPNLALNLKSTQFCDKLFLPVALKASLQIVSFYFHTTVSLFLFSPPFFSLLGCCDCILAFGLWGLLT